MKPKRPSLSTLQNKADRLASQYIRQKYADHTGRINCVTCGVSLPWKDSECAHYIERGFIGTRWTEENLHPACTSCNHFRKEFHKRQYTLAMLDMYGRDKIDELQATARRVLSPMEKRLMAVEAIQYYSRAIDDLNARMAA